MKNKFYNTFDYERIEVSKRGNDYRSPFQIDRDRIIHSSEFRRLQGKTQVFLPGEYDFYRTRLTHSIEVAQIGRSICNYLIHQKNSPFNEDFYIDPDLVEAACLAHDLGHPPFGHAGERTLNKIMTKYGGFEGNAQTLRLLTETFYRREKSKKGMNPSRALLDGILKYKTLFSQLDDPYNHYLYDTQMQFLKFVFGDRQLPKDLAPGVHLDELKSIECQIMDWADDTAYAINDLVDSISGGFMTIANLDKWGTENGAKLIGNQKEFLDEIIEWIKTGKFKAKFGTQVGDFIHACTIKERTTFMDDLTNRYKYILVIDQRYREKAKLYKQIAIDLVFHSPQLHQMEFKGDFMIRNIFKVFEENYIEDISKIKLTEDFTHNYLKKENNIDERARLVCDYVAGMTDSFAMRTYKRLFDPDYSSLVDFV